MPVYEFICEACQQRFEATQSVAEHEKGAPTCPRCGSNRRVVPQLSDFFAKTSRKA